MTRRTARAQPFVGPAGRLLDEALVAAGIDRTRAYVTNTVKHFKFTPRGKRRILGSGRDRLSGRVMISTFGPLAASPLPRDKLLMAA